ncbi:sortase, partial [Candidatus Dojkabacteria bacterium]|nr:sortase [Candidatus Dojkabacteria bacterium]
MPLYKYKKAPVQYKRQYRSRKPQSSEVVLEIQREPLTIWKLLQGIKNDITEILTTSRFAGTVVPAICIIYGLNLLLGQIIPSATQFIQAQTGGLEQGALAIVPSNFVSAKQSFLSDPGSTYFEQIQQNAKRARVLEIDPVSNSYNGIFSLSIPNLNLSNLSVQANTNSGVETIYDQVLENGLAHMESTGLPISSTPNNIVIYGHSAGGDYYKRTGDPAAAFTILTDIKLGDTIDVTIEGKDYSYKVSKTKIVEPTDLSIIAGEGNPSIQTLTLFTCYPPGN